MKQNKIMARSCLCAFAILILYRRLLYLTPVHDNSLMINTLKTLKTIFPGGYDGKLTLK